MSLLSVLIVSHGTRALLARCLDTLAAPLARGEIEVVVADNASPDGSAAMVRERFPRVALLALDSNLGFATATNRAARNARGELLLLLNPDAELPDGGPAAIGEALARRGPAAAVGFRQVNERGVFQLAYGEAPGFASEWARRRIQRRLDRGDLALAARLDREASTPRPVAWVAGSSLAVRRETYLHIGGLDEGFFLFFEDIDFCLRLRAAGGEVWYDPSVTVVHRRGASAARAAALAKRAYRESQLRFWERHRGRWARRLVRAWLTLRGVAP